MYRNISALEHKQYLNLPPSYQVDGLLIHGTWNITKEASLLAESLNNLGINYEFNKFEKSDFLNIGYELKINGKTIWFFVVYGGALASEFTHLACLFGSKKTILLGSCGGLKKGLLSGDIILPTKSKSDGSVCFSYDREENDFQTSDDNLRTKMREELEKQYTVYEGPTTTCQAMLGETEGDIHNWAGQGYYGVEMEASTVFAVSNHFKVPSAAILRCGDNLIENETVLSKSFQENRPLRLDQKLILNQIAVQELLS